MNKPNVSVVIPTLNEQSALPGCLESVGCDPDVEILVSDGGSSDRTVEVAGRFPGVRVVRGAMGRGPQLNRGAASAGGRLLLFLHADCRLPAGWRGAVERALEDQRNVLAVFRHVTVPKHGAGPLRRAWLGLLDLRSRGLALPYGDQGFAIRRTVFDGLGGFPDIPLMEDLDFARTCRREGRIHHIADAIQTSARRFESAPVKTRVMLAAFPWLYRAGVDPHRLARWYGVVR